MKFISYAQNREDVLLWRALQHVTPGFYIDVGANDPSTDSVTRSFYERGWCGINIEPHPDFHQRLQKERARDLNLALAVGAEPGELTLFDVPERRGWASLDQAVALRHQQEGFALSPLPVAVRTLADICSDHVRGDIHFLKIDVEGFEKQALQGMDFQVWRPWVVVVEATEPGTRIASHQEWEDLILGHQYQFAYFDGINRFYVAEEHAGLLPALRVQANFLDDFVPLELARAWEAENHANDAILARQQLQVSFEHAQAANERLQAELVVMRASHAEHIGQAQTQSALAQFQYGRALYQLSALEADRLQLQTQLQHITARLSQSQDAAAQAERRANASLLELEQANHSAAAIQRQLAESEALAAQTERHAGELAGALDLSRRQCGELAELNQQLHQRLGLADARAEDLEQRLASLNVLLLNIVHSWSWRLTWPLRALNRHIEHGSVGKRSRSSGSAA